MTRPIIKDIVVVAEVIKYEKDGTLKTIYPIGEAPMMEQTFEPMTAAERTDTQEPIFRT